MTPCLEDEFVQLGLSPPSMTVMYSLFYNIASISYLPSLRTLFCHAVASVAASVGLFYVSNLVDSASSHTLVSKIKPCMSKYKYFTLKLRTAHYISYSLFDSPLLLGYP